MVTLYTTHCPLCERLEKRLQEYDIPYSIIDSLDQIVEFCNANDTDTLPLLQVNDNVLDYGTAMRWAKGGGNAD